MAMPNAEMNGDGMMIMDGRNAPSFKRVLSNDKFINVVASEITIKKERASDKKRVRTIKSQQALHDFERQRRHAEQILGLKLYAGANSSKRLHEQTKAFHQAVKEDDGKAPAIAVQGTSRAFEKELHASIEKLIVQTKADITSLQKTMDEWTSLKRTIKGKDEHYAAVLETERRYAEVLTSSMGHRLDALNNSFRRLRRR
jgi:hypothetical protein